MTTLLTKALIQQASDIDLKKIEIAEWGGYVFIKQLSRGVQDEYLRRQFGRADVGSTGETTEIRGATVFGHDVFIVINGVVDEDGKNMFTDKDTKWLKEKNGAVVGKLARAIIEFSDMVEDIEAMEEQAKN